MNLTDNQQIGLFLGCWIALAIAYGMGFWTGSTIEKSLNAFQGLFMVFLIFIGGVGFIAGCVTLIARAISL